MRTRADVERLLYAAIKGRLQGHIGGGVYRRGMRPYDSRSEDCVVSVTALTAAQTQVGEASVTILVPPANATDRGGGLLPDLARIATLQRTLADTPWRELLPEVPLTPRGAAFDTDTDSEGWRALCQRLDLKTFNHDF